MKAFVSTIDIRPQYVLTNSFRTLYLGVTNDLVGWGYGIDGSSCRGFTKKYNATWLAY